MWRGLVLALVLLLAIAVGTVAGIVAAYSRNLPDIKSIADYQPASSTRIFARDGTQLASVYKENRVWMPIAQIPAVVRDAFIANEDHNFYQHHGVDFGGIIRAGFADLSHQHLQGASTITQQLARKLFLNDQVSISRKIQEALLAIEIERYYTKDEILERYLNIVYLGSGAYGVDAAAHTYFGTSVERLSLGQAAMLAGVVAAPSDYSPFVDLPYARDRQLHVLQRMTESGFITQEQAIEAFRSPLQLNSERKEGLQGYRYPYFTTYVISQLESLFGTQAVQEGGLQVNTTLDPHMQQLAQEAVDWGVNAAKTEGIGAHQAAMVAIKPSTGEIMAMVGGTNFSLANQFNRAWQARRQPGSSFKVYVYTAAIDSGMSPSTVMDDSPVYYPMGDGTNWQPTDDDGSYMGAITLRKALALSRNVVAVKLADQIGLDRVISYAHRMGVQSQLDANLSLALGSSVVTVLDQASGYATLANQGVHVELTPFRTVRDLLGNVVLNNQYPQSEDVVSAGTAYIMTTMLEDVIAMGTGTNANIGRPAAGKTGTTSSFRDAWFVGYTPDLVAAVWLGNDDYTRMNESYGGNIPARIWARFMKAALAKTPPHAFTIPSNEITKLDCGGITDYHLSNVQSDPGCGVAHSMPVTVQLPPPVELPHNGGEQTLPTPSDLPSIDPEKTVPPDDSQIQTEPPPPPDATPRAQNASDLPSPP